GPVAPCSHAGSQSEAGPPPSAAPISLAGASAAASTAGSAGVSSQSSSGLDSTATVTSCSSSTPDNCRRWMAWRNWGVSRSCWPSATWRVGFIACFALEPESFAEVDAAHVRVRQQLVRRALRQHLAIIEDVGAVADAQRLAHVVVGDQHPDAAVAQVADDAL